MQKARTVFALAAAIALGAPAAAHAATIPVQQLNGDFAASNSTVTKTPDGVHFGTYADGGAIGGTMTYTGFNGHTLSELTDFSYTFTYREAGVTTGAAPYERVFLDTDITADTDGDGNPANDVDSDVILDPSFCATVRPPISTDLTFQMVGNSVRYGDDGCDPTTAIEFGQQPWATVVANHGDDVIVGLLVSQGNSTGTDVSALLRNITVNADTFAFNVAPVGPAGPPGPVTIQQVPVVVPGAAVLGTQATHSCRGATLRRIHAPNRKGAKFLRVAAVLSTPSGLRALKVNGRTITVDLRNRPSANYNVRLISRYRTKSGKTRRVVTRRNLSVACS